MISAAVFIDASAYCQESKLSSGTNIVNRYVIVKKGLIINPSALTSAELFDVLFGRPPIFINGARLRDRKSIKPNDSDITPSPR